MEEGKNDRNNDKNEKLEEEKEAEAKMTLPLLRWRKV